ncbi:MAG: DUF4153 domain-containing protein [Candidatus Aquicultorales bacterium]
MKWSERSASAVICAGLALGILFDLFFYLKSPGISVALFTLIVFTAVLAIARVAERRITPCTLSFGAVALAFAGWAAIRKSPVLLAIDMILVVYFSMAFISGLTGRSLRNLNLAGHASYLFRQTFVYLTAAFWAYADFIKALAGPKRARLGEILLGISIAVPLIVVLGALLAAADLAFAKYVDQVVAFLKRIDAAELQVIIYSGTVFTGMLAWVALRKPQEEPEARNEPRASGRKLEIATWSIVLGAIDLLFSLFVAVQFAYLFGGDRNIKELGLTYAEYAHRGFFELVAVAVLSFIVVWALEKRASFDADAKTRWFAGLSGGLIGLVGVIMVSAFMRLTLYEGVYGFTVLRLYTQFFIVLLGLLFSVFLLKLFLRKGEEWFCLRALAVLAVFIFGLNAANPDSIIARLNLERYEKTKKAELLLYTIDLSDDATPELVQAHFYLKGSADDDRIAAELAKRKVALEKRPWQSYTLSGRLALESLNKWEVENNVAR